jgi:hypothetical protein
VSDNKDKGILPKYNVSRTDGKPTGFCFVLDVSRDPIAIEALSAYAMHARHAGYTKLADELAVQVSAARDAHLMVTLKQDLVRGQELLRELTADLLFLEPLSNHPNELRGKVKLVRDVIRKLIGPDPIQSNQLLVEAQRYASGD